MLAAQSLGQTHGNRVTWGDTGLLWGCLTKGPRGGVEFAVQAAERSQPAGTETAPPHWPLKCPPSHGAMLLRPVHHVLGDCVRLRSPGMRHQEGEIAFKGAAHAVAGSVSPKSPGQAGTQGKAQPFLGEGLGSLGQPLLRHGR